MNLFLIRCLLLSFILFLVSCKRHSSVHTNPSDLNALQLIYKPQGDFKAYRSKVPVVIDGYDNDSIWLHTSWYSMNYKWMGKEVDSTDYYGKFKLAWDPHYLYIMVEITDEFLNPTLSHGIENYWKGDYVEVFIDEDRSGGIHKFNHQAFAYHVSTEGHAIDKSTTEATIFFDDHVKVKRIHEGGKYFWEMAITLFDNRFDESISKNVPVVIKKQKTIGFSIAYGDNDGHNSREHFMGSKRTHGHNNDEGYVSSDVFGSVVFVE